jgi:hypothetical protein
MLSRNLALASSNYMRLKNHLGQSHNGERRPSFDDHHGERHQAMIELQEHLGQVGTSADQIEHLMGSPTKMLDKPDDMLLYELRRNNENYTYPNDTKIWVYEWRSNRDYVYFLVSKDKKVIQSAWSYSYE